MKKTLMIATAALALTAGAATLTSSSAQAGGYGFHVGYGHNSYNYNYNYVAPSCYTIYKKVRIKVYGYYGWHFKWIVKPVEVCY